jgi:hypothetical protein
MAVKKKRETIDCLRMVTSPLPGWAAFLDLVTMAVAEGEATLPSAID